MLSTLFLGTQSITPYRPCPVERRSSFLYFISMLDSCARNTHMFEYIMKIVPTSHQEWSLGSKVLLSSSTSDLSRILTCLSSPGENAERIDLVLTLGGDGTILHASSLFRSGAVPPVLSFSMGTLGFLLPFRACTIRLYDYDRASRRSPRSDTRRRHRRLRSRRRRRLRGPRDGSVPDEAVVRVP